MHAIVGRTGMAEDHQLVRQVGQEGVALLHEAEEAVLVIDYRLGRGGGDGLASQPVSVGADGQRSPGGTPPGLLPLESRRRPDHAGTRLRAGWLAS